MTQRTLTYYGKLAELTGKPKEEITTDAHTVGALKDRLIDLYPALKKVSFKLAQGQAIADDKDLLTDTNIDVFPPFSGG